MASFNKIFLIGHMTGDPELKQTSNGDLVTSFCIGVGRKPAKDGTQQTDFVNVVAWKGTAEFITKYFKKGMPILVFGSLRTRSYEKDGQKRTITEVVADEVNFVERKEQRETFESPSESYHSSNMANAKSFEEISPDDDLPF